MATLLSYEGFDEPEDEAPRSDYSSYDTGAGSDYDASGNYTGGSDDQAPTYDTPSYDATGYDASGNYTGGAATPNSDTAPVYAATAYDASGNDDSQPAPSYDARDGRPAQGAFTREEARGRGTEPRTPVEWPVISYDGFDESAVDWQGEYVPASWMDWWTYPEHVLPLLREY